MNVCFHYHFHPVKQGLFASGVLYVANTPQPRFLWVYDCGNVGPQSSLVWKAKVGELKRFAHGKASIELLTLSHFDNDHISGVTALLAQFSVETLMLPYVPLWERLLIAFEREIGAEDERMGYYIDPVAYLRNLPGAQIDRVIVVLPSEGDGPGVSEQQPVELPPRDKLWKLARTKQLDANAPRARDFGSEADGLEFLLPGQVLTVLSLWEFCPFNAPRPPQTGEFISSVTNHREHLLNATDADARGAALTRLKVAFDEEFGSGGKQRNVISLFLYTGPVYSTWKTCKLISPLQALHPAYPARYPCYYRALPGAPGLTRKCSLLYSGDAYLNTAEKFIALKNYLSEDRMERLGVFQVNHHGAKRNWHQGLADKLAPLFSVFSSDPKRGPTYHPHAEVLRDFWLRSPVQVCDVGSSFCGWLLPRD